MVQARVLVLRAPGVNCDEETAYAFERAGGLAERVHLGRLLEAPQLLDQYQVLCIPGGFSYGDDIAAGRILGNRLRQQLAARIADFKAAGKLILGICNGFQVLIKSGVLLPDTPGEPPPATLSWNDSGKYEDRWVQLSSAGHCVFFAGIESMYLPVAHAEGKFVPRSAAALSALDAAGQLALRYAPRDADAAQAATAGVPYPANPNGSIANVAAVCDTTGRVCGLMPHPERYIDPTQHPRWTRQSPLPEVGDGLRVFQNAVRYFG